MARADFRVPMLICFEVSALIEVVVSGGAEAVGERVVAMLCQLMRWEDCGESLEWKRIRIGYLQILDDVCEA
jgi:hypothetical protein